MGKLKKALLYNHYNTVRTKNTLNHHRERDGERERGRQWKREKKKDGERETGGNNTLIILDQNRRPITLLMKNSVKPINFKEHFQGN